MRNTFAETAKRAARHNPAWRTAAIYSIAEDEGVTVFTASGDLQFDRIDSTYGFLDLTAEAEFTDAVSYQGNSRVTVISAQAPNGVALILLDDVFYVVQSVVSSDGLQATVRYACNALPINEAPNIRNA